ncbi:hypothetical protein SISNIDRAFT_484869 [Sistotremastrum niveocremeum HHB9708]|uniref:Uncharacterized protein n=1 Tax=Sistotremastrum niveocremeum HHB9708 TaxID=1314777 RepID=A0A164V7T0_9AGAM|nr:hypothetical protein SISNIDRAFT_484869 [Sistotremastrum niveocremeum HHB9708]
MVREPGSRVEGGDSRKTVPARDYWRVWSEYSKGRPNGMKIIAEVDLKSTARLWPPRTKVVSFFRSRSIFLKTRYPDSLYDSGWHGTVLSTQSQAVGDIVNETGVRVGGFEITLIHSEIAREHRREVEAPPTRRRRRRASSVAASRMESRTTAHAMIVVVSSRATSNSAVASEYLDIQALCQPSPYDITGSITSTGFTLAPRRFA